MPHASLTLIFKELLSSVSVPDPNPTKGDDISGPRAVFFQRLVLSYNFYDFWFCYRDRCHHDFDENLQSALQALSSYSIYCEGVEADDKQQPTTTEPEQVPKTPNTTQLADSAGCASFVSRGRSDLALYRRPRLLSR